MPLDFVLGEKSKPLLGIYCLIINAWEGSKFVTVTIFYFPLEKESWSSTITIEFAHANQTRDKPLQYLTKLFYW